MSDQQNCAQCGAEVPASAPAGLCPACLLKAALASNPDVAASLSRTQISPPNAGFVPPEPAEIAALFPQLEILEIIGKGGMGAVYKARHPGLDRLVAIKILPDEISHDPTFAERFQREARALARLTHPNIIAIYDFGQTKGLFYFVMEFVDGANLRQAIRGGGLKSQEALAIVPQICDALQFAHDEGIVHRDIKPENILIDKKGRVKIADFGLAKLLGESSPDHPLTGTHQVMGTIRYMAPEQMQGSREVDHRADIYSLGVVFYELLTGELPMGRFAPPSKKVQIDVRLDEVVLRTLEQDPQQRYQHASDVKCDVENVTREQVSPAKEADARKNLQSVTERPQHLTASAAGLDSSLRSNQPNGRQLKAPGIALMLFGLVLILPAVLCFTNGLDIVDGNDATPAAAGGVLIVVSFLVMGLAGLIMRGGWHMLTLDSYRAAVLGSFLSPPIGIWGLVILARPDVRAAFRTTSVSRPSGAGKPMLVPILAVINVLSGILLMMFSSMDDASLTSPSVPRIWQIWGQVDAAVGFVMAAGLFAASIGLFLWQSWARKLTLAVCVFGLATVVLDSPYLTRSVIPELHREVLQETIAEGVGPGDQEVVAAAITFVLVAGVLLLYLVSLIGQLVYFTRPRVIAAFNGTAKVGKAESGGAVPPSNKSIYYSVGASIAGGVALVLVVGMLMSMLRNHGHETAPLSSVVPPAVPPDRPVRTEVWHWTPAGPDLDEKYARFALEFRPEQVTDVNAVLREIHGEFLKLEEQYAELVVDAAERHRTTIKPFPDPLAKLENKLWMKLDPILDTRQQSLARLNVDWHAKPFQAPMSISDIVAPGFFGWGKEGATIEIWRVGSWYHWRIRTRTYDHEASNPAELPAELARFWNHKTPGETGPSVAQSKPHAAAVEKVDSPPEKASPVLPEGVKLEQVGHVPDGGDDPFLSMAVEGKYAYLLQGNVAKPKRLQVVDLTDPAKPKVVGAIPVTVEAMRVAVFGKHAYVLDEPHLKVIDVSDPTAPREVGKLELGEHLWDVAILGRFAYITDVESVRVIDLEDPTKPKQVGRCEVESAQCLTVVGQHAYIACDVDGLYIIDISNAEAPKEVGHFRKSAGAADVVVSDKYAYIAGGEDAVTLWTVDISNPAKPKSVGKYGDWIAGSVAVQGTTAYLAGGEMDILDMTDPATPKKVGSHSGVEMVIVVGELIYTIGEEGFSILKRN